MNNPVSRDPRLAELVDELAAKLEMPKPTLYRSSEEIRVDKILRKMYNDEKVS